MSRRLPGSLLLILLVLGLLYTRSVWAGSNGIHSADVLVRISPLSLLMKNEVTVKVGDYTCSYAGGSEPASVCSDLPSGEYEVSATSAGYFVVPSSVHIDLSSDDDNDLYFRLYRNNHQLYMPGVHVGE